MTGPPNGADAVVAALADRGVTVCFANPGTSEMHLVAALDREPRIRAVLCLFEGVATGAADGFGRIAGRPAMTLLHLGPGYANGAANLHNARRAFTPVINIVGDHATTHAALDAPLASDIAGIASASSIWVRETHAAAALSEDAAAAFDAAVTAPGGPATLIVPADCAWSAAAIAAAPAKDVARPTNPVQTEAVALAVRSANAPAILLGGHATQSEAALAAAARLAAAGATVFADTFVARQLRGGDRFEPRRLPYFSEHAVAELSRHDLLVLAGSTAPVSFFAYPDKPGNLVPDDMRTVTLCSRADDVAACLLDLAIALAAPSVPDARPRVRHAIPSGKLTPATVGASLARHLATGSIVSDDGVTSSGPVFAATVQANPHDWLSLTGGAIGQGLPVAIGAAIARPGARVVALTGDGAAMYTPQALWTMAREQLDITIIVFANRAYRILDIEFARTGSGVPGLSAARLLDIGDPAIDWCGFARAMGVDARRCDDALSLDIALGDVLRSPGPHLIEARID